MNIVIPMCGFGLRVKEEFNLPKPLININGKTLIERCIETTAVKGNYIFITRSFNEFNEGEKLDKKLREILLKYTKEDNIISVSEPTMGAVDSILKAKKLIDNKSPLMVVNCDQILNWKPQEFLEHIKLNKLDACVTTYNFSGIKVGKISPYSFIEMNGNKASKFEEKFAISRHALNGIAYWSKGQDFVKSAEELIQSKVLTNNEFYVSKTFNFLIKDGLKIGFFEMEKDQYISLGNTQEILDYLSEKSDI